MLDGRELNPAIFGIPETDRFNKVRGKAAIEKLVWSGVTFCSSLAPTVPEIECKTTSTS